MREKTLTYYPLLSLQDIDWKIKEVGKYWQDVKIKDITFSGGAYSIILNVRGLKND